MSNATYARMIPYPVIESAARGDADAVNEVIRHYSGYIAALVKRTDRDANGNYCTYVDEELRRRLESKMIVSILDFDLSAWVAWLFDKENRAKYSRQYKGRRIRSVGNEPSGRCAMISCFVGVLYTTTMPQTAGKRLTARAL